MAHQRFDTPSKVIKGIEQLIAQRARRAREHLEFAVPPGTPPTAAGAPGNGAGCRSRAPAGRAIHPAGIGAVTLAAGRGAAPRPLPTWAPRARRRSFSSWTCWPRGGTRCTPLAPARKPACTACWSAQRCSPPEPATTPAGPWTGPPSVRAGRWPMAHSGPRDPGAGARAHRPGTAQHAGAGLRHRAAHGQRRRHRGGRPGRRGSHRYRAPGRYRGRPDTEE